MHHLTRISRTNVSNSRSNRTSSNNRRYPRHKRPTPHHHRNITPSFPCYNSSRSLCTFRPLSVSHFAIATSSSPSRYQLQPVSSAPRRHAASLPPYLEQILQQPVDKVKEPYGGPKPRVINIEPKHGYYRNQAGIYCNYYSVAQEQLTPAPGFANPEVFSPKQPALAIAEIDPTKMILCPQVKKQTMQEMQQALDLQKQKEIRAGKYKGFPLETLAQINPDGSFKR